MTSAASCSDSGPGPAIDVHLDSPTKKQRISDNASPTMHEDAGKRTPRSSRSNSAATASPVPTQAAVRAQSVSLQIVSVYQA